MTIGSDQHVAVVLPALNEEEAIVHVLKAIPSWVSQIIVVDNGSTDRTAEVAAAYGATVVRETRRGYGAACLAGLAALRDPHIVVFIGGDHSDDPTEVNQLVKPILRDEADLIIGSRVLGKAEKGSLSLPQRFGNVLASTLIRWIWRTPCTDLGPFRAVRFDALRRLAMNDLGYGWTVQMQARAAHMGLRMIEVPVSCRRRIAGTSKISGTIRGTIGAGTKILGTIAREAMGGGRVLSQRRRLLVFTRFPEPGTTKTRLIPVLGPDGAAAIQRDMTHHTLDVAREWRKRPDDEVEVRFAGGSRAQMEEAFGRDMRYVAQGEGVLGERLARAAQDAFRSGCGQVVIIGCDCPQIDVPLLRQAFDALRTDDVVLGPASDGGYYLIGLKRPAPRLFEGIAWGADCVFRQTQERAAKLGLAVACLPARSDVDEPADLEVWHQAEQRRCQVDSAPRISIIMPVMNEADSLPAAIASIGHVEHTEVIVVDGGSTDDTTAVARSLGAQVIEAPEGRASQMNAGATAARGRILLFLHADTRLPFGWADQVANVLAAKDVVAGAFRLAFDAVSPALRFIEHAANLRSSLLAKPYGDQAVFLPRAVFQQVGGFRDLPVMEDYDLICRLRRLGRIGIAPLAAITSARRWLDAGILRTTLRHQSMIVGWHIGVPPGRLARWRGCGSRGDDATKPHSNGPCGTRRLETARAPSQ